MCISGVVGWLGWRVPLREDGFWWCVNLKMISGGGIVRLTGWSWRYD